MKSLLSIITNNLLNGHLIMMKKIKIIEAQHLLLATSKRITTNSNSLI